MLYTHHEHSLALASPFAASGYKASSILHSFTESIATRHAGEMACNWHKVNTWQDTYKASAFSLYWKHFLEPINWHKVSYHPATSNDKGPGKMAPRLTEQNASMK